MDTETPSGWSLLPILKRLRLRQVGIALIVLAVVIFVGYLASLYNRSKYFLVVDATHVRVEQGRMLPFGSEPYIPDDAKLVKAYRAVPLPKGWQVPAGVSTYGDLTQLEQSLFRILMDAAQFTLESGDAATTARSTRYLDQIDALAHLSPQQRDEAGQLRRTARYLEARGHFDGAVELLKKAQKLFEASATSQGGDRYKDGKQRADAIRQALTLMLPLEASTVTDTGAADTGAADTGSAEQSGVDPSTSEESAVPSSEGATSETETTAESGTEGAPGDVSAEIGDESQPELVELPRDRNVAISSSTTSTTP